MTHMINLMILAVEMRRQMTPMTQWASQSPQEKHQVGAATVEELQGEVEELVAGMVRPQEGVVELLGDMGLLQEGEWGEEVTPALLGSPCHLTSQCSSLAPPAAETQATSSGSRRWTWPPSWPCPAPATPGRRGPPSWPATPGPAPAAADQNQDLGPKASQRFPSNF